MYNIEHLPSAWKGHRAFAEWLVTRLQPKTVVELGFDYGYSAFCFANPDIGTVYGIDTFEGDIHTGYHSDAYSVVSTVIKENNYTNIQIIKDRFENVASTWSLPIDILHIDGLHTYEDTLKNYNDWKHYLHSDSVVLMHDTTSFPDVRRVFEEIQLNKLSFHYSAGLGVLSSNLSLINEIKIKFNV